MYKMEWIAGSGFKVLSCLCREQNSRLGTLFDLIVLFVIRFAAFKQGDQMSLRKNRPNVAQPVFASINA
jgi:hypothetical protein